jgi:hypothetical protein
MSNFVTDQVMPDKCPHCQRGALKQVPAYYGWQYECTVCGRGWVVLDRKYWLACFDAGGHVYEIEANGNIKDRNGFRDNKFREELWDRVRNGTDGAISTSKGENKNVSNE